jgi:hypothetical protein
VAGETRDDNRRGNQPSGSHEASVHHADDDRSTEGPTETGGVHGLRAAEDEGRIRPTEGGSDQTPSRLGKAGRGTWKWLIGLAGVFVAAVVTTVAGHLAGGWFSTSPAATPTPTPTPALTQVRLMQVFDPNGTLLPPYKPSQTLTGGMCTNSNESSDPDALRCYSGGTIADPCWEGVHKVACLATPWDTQALIIVNPQISVTQGEAIESVPWALEISDPAHPGRILQCGFAGGTAAEYVAGLRANWLCGPPDKPAVLSGYALGSPQMSDSKPWTVYYASSSALATKVHRVGHAALGLGRPQRCWRSLRMRARSRRWAASTPGWRAWALRQRR